MSFPVNILMQDLRSFCRTPDQAGPGGDRNVGIFFFFLLWGFLFILLLVNFLRDVAAECWSDSWALWTENRSTFQMTSVHGGNLKHNEWVAWTILFIVSGNLCRALSIDSCTVISTRQRNCCDYKCHAHLIKIFSLTVNTVWLCILINDDEKKSNCVP